MQLSCQAAGIACAPATCLRCSSAMQMPTARMRTTLHMPSVIAACLQTWLWLEGWRWCFFSAGFIPIYYISEAFVHVAELLVEKQLFTVQQALYFAVSIHVSSNMGCTPSHAADNVAVGLC